MGRVCRIYGVMKVVRSGGRDIRRAIGTNWLFQVGEIDGKIEFWVVIASELDV